MPRQIKQQVARSKGSRRLDSERRERGDSRQAKASLDQANGLLLRADDFRLIRVVSPTSAPEGGVVPAAPGAGRQHERGAPGSRTASSRTARNATAGGITNAAPPTLGRAFCIALGPCLADAFLIGRRSCAGWQSAGQGESEQGGEREWSHGDLVYAGLFVACGFACRRPPRLREGSDSDHRLTQRAE